MKSNNSYFYTDSGLIINGENYNQSDASYLSCGNYGSVYRYSDDKVIKLVDSDGTEEQYETMSSIKDLNLPNFYKLYEILYRNSVDGVKTFGGTIAKYYPREDFDIFLQPSEYLLESFNSLYRAMIQLGMNGISVFDLNRRNVIVNREGIYVIDADLYQKLGNSLTWKIALKNLYRMKDSIFYDLMISNFFKYHKNISSEYANEFIKIIYDLLNMDDYENSSVFNDTLSKYRYPIDYIKSKRL